MIVKPMSCFSFFFFASLVKLLFSFFISLPLVSSTCISKKPPGMHDKIIDFSKIMTEVDGALLPGPPAKFTEGREKCVHKKENSCTAGPTLGC